MARRPALGPRPSAGRYLAATAAIAVGGTLTLLPGAGPVLPGGLMLGGGALPDAPARAGVLTLMAFVYEWAGLRAERRRGVCQNESAQFRAVGTPYFPVLLAAVLMLPPAAAGLVPLPGLVLAAWYARSGRADCSEPAAEQVDGEDGDAYDRRVRRVLAAELRPMVRPLWNAAQLALAAMCAGVVFRLLDGPRMLADALPGTPVAGDRTLPLPAVLVPVWPATLAYVLTGGVLVAGARMLAEGVDRRTACRGLLRRSLLPALAHGLVGLLMAVLWQGPYGAFAGALVLIPLTVSAWVLQLYRRERSAHSASVRALVQAVEIKDSYTRGHSERVGRAAVLMAGQLRMDEERIASLRVAGTLHDVGKLGVPTRVLRKNGPLTPAERGAIELHPEYGHEMVRGIAFLGEARAGILHHHERWDGRGYPFGLAGESIPEFGRLIAVADAFDSMTSTRSYRRGRPVSEAVVELRRCAGTQFDPEMVAALVSAVSRHGWRPAPAPTGPEAAAVPDIPLGLRANDPGREPEGRREHERRSDQEQEPAPGPECEHAHESSPAAGAPLRAGTGSRAGVARLRAVRRSE